MIEIQPQELSNRIGQLRTIEYEGKWQENILTQVKGNVFAMKIIRKNKWDIEIWYSLPVGDSKIKFFANE